RADALLAVFRAAASAPADGQPPEPVVNVVIDEQTLATELASTAGEDVRHDPARVLNGQRVCRTTEGAVLHPSDAVAALVVGHVRRVVLDSQGTVIDLGRRRRCFTGASRHAALLQDAIRNRSGTRCFWASCLSPPGQVDHHDAWHRHGPTAPSNSQPACGHHNRLKETGYRNVLAPDGTVTYLRPDGTRITPPA
ncbi:MAG TPA: HNH endonuclease signature motif containing protein, partial [Acidimicrobiales bacterium]|nr:HNH endonuclease signature motif containing protein [Acidimicrobiales bacterium]